MVENNKVHEAIEEVIAKMVVFFFFEFCQVSQLCAFFYFCFCFFFVLTKNSKLPHHISDPIYHIEKYNHITYLWLCHCFFVQFYRIWPRMKQLYDLLIFSFFKRTSSPTIILFNFSLLSFSHPIRFSKPVNIN